MNNKYFLQKGLSNQILLSLFIEEVKSLGMFNTSKQVGIGFYTLFQRLKASQVVFYYLDSKHLKGRTQL